MCAPVGRPERRPALRERALTAARNPSSVRRFSRKLAIGLKEFARRAEADLNGRSHAAREDPMAVRPFAFGARLRHGDRTLRVRRHERDARSYLLEDSDPRRGTRRRDHVSLDGALRDLARSWRARLH